MTEAVVSTNQNLVTAREQSIEVLTGGQSESVAISSTSAQSAVINTGDVVIVSTVDCFIRQGTSPTALSDGTDQFILANVAFRLTGIVKGSKIAAKTSAASGTLYISPGA